MEVKETNDVSSIRGGTHGWLIAVYYDSSDWPNSPSQSADKKV